MQFLLFFFFLLLFLLLLLLLLDQNSISQAPDAVGSGCSAPCLDTNTCQTECQNLWQVERSKKVAFYSSSVGYSTLSHGSVWKGAPHTHVAPARFGVRRSALSRACGALTFERDVILRGRCGTPNDSDPSCGRSLPLTSWCKHGWLKTYCFLRCFVHVMAHSFSSIVLGRFNDMCWEKKQFMQEQRNHYCPTHGIQHAWGANNLKIITLLRVIPTLTSHSDIVSDIASGINNIINMYSDGLSGILSGITPDILCDILSGILSCIYISLFLWRSHSFWQSIWHIFWHFIWHSFWHSIWYHLAYFDTLTRIYFDILLASILA